MYEPKPIDTTYIELSDEIGKLVEKLAENTHDIWAIKRIQDGWTFGEKRDDDMKKHPCLVPYDELPEEEKVYDRKITAEVLKTIMAIGYKIEKI